MNSITREKYVLNNGVPVVFYKKIDAPIAGKIYFSTGSQYDPIGKDGLTHYMEHLLMQVKQEWVIGKI